MSATRSTFRRRLRRAVTGIALAIGAVAASLARLGDMRPVRASTSPRLLAGGLAAVVAVTGLAATGGSADASALPGGTGQSAAAVAQMWVATRPALLRAVWNKGTDVAFGQHEDGRMVTSLDIVGHELGHGVDQFTPGGPSGKGTAEFIGDAFGTATEWYAREPAGYDTADYVMGDGFPGWERYMYDPGSTPHPEGSYSSSCFKPDTDTDEVHLAAGVGDHWFYQRAEGSNPTNGQPTSPTCNHATVTGVGIQTAIRILYTSMLMKTSNSSYPAYRLWTLRRQPTSTAATAWSSAESGPPGTR